MQYLKIMKKINNCKKRYYKDDSQGETAFNIQEDGKMCIVTLVQGHRWDQKTTRDYKNWTDPFPQFRKIVYFVVFTLNSHLICNGCRCHIGKYADNGTQDLI